MHTYTLTLSFFIFFATTYIAIKIQPKITINKTLISIFSAAILSITVFFSIKFLNNLTYDSAIKHSFFILNIYLIYLTFKFLLLKNEDLFWETFSGYKIEPELELNKIYMSFIGLSFSLYGILYFEQGNIFSFILFILIPLILIMGTVNNLAITLIIIFTIPLNFYLILTTIISLIIIKLFNLFLSFLNEKYFEKISYSQIFNLAYNFSFDSTYEFILKFKPIKSDFYILYFYDEKEDITYSFELDIKDKLKEIASINKLKMFFILPLSKNKINVSFDNIKFYYNKGRNYKTTSNSKEINLENESEDLEKIIIDNIKIKEMLKY